MIFLTKQFEKIYGLEDITKMKEEELFEFFAKMRNGTIRKKDGGIYKSTADYVKVFKAFWHWYQKINYKQGRNILDITQDLDTRREKPKWVYLTEDETERLCKNAKYEYAVLISFLIDTGIRSPTELVNIKIQDLHNNCKELNIRDEISKTFGRKIKLMLCSEAIEDYIQRKGLKGNDYLFDIKPRTVNKYFQRIAERMFGDKVSPAGEKYSKLTMYDFRHISCCYWQQRCRKEATIMYRFGWTRSDKVHYYSEFLGMKEDISEDDLYPGTTKTEIQRELEKTGRENKLLRDKMSMMEQQMAQISERLSKMLGRF